MIHNKAYTYKKVWCHEVKFIDFDLEGTKRKATFIADRIVNLYIENNKIYDGQDCIATFEDGKWLLNFEAPTFKLRYGARKEQAKADQVFFNMTFYNEIDD